jgi:membrane-associated phospholipid phosphatase
MNQDADSLSLDGHWFRRAALALPVCGVLVTACYLWVDRPVAWFVHDRGINRVETLRWLTLPPPVLLAWTPAVLAVLVVRRVWRPWPRWQRTLFTAALALIVADQFRESLGFAFGRYWPETWRDQNPSLIANNAYGFHFFHGGPWYGSFPSGHTTMVLILVAVYWVACPRSRPLGVAAAICIAVGLVGMNYHFVSDVVAGGFLGALVGSAAAKLASLDRPCALPMPPP